MLRKLTLSIVSILLVCRAASAQVVTAPPTAHFVMDDANFAKTATFHQDFFQCTSLAAPVPPSTTYTCVGKASSPFQSGVDIPKANVTGGPGTAPRVISFTTPPVNGFIASTPIGVAFVSNLIAIGDPAAGSNGSSARSNDSGPFYPQAGGPPASPTQYTVP